MSENQHNGKAEKLKNFFKEKGMTQEDVAQRLNIPQSLVSRYLNGKPFGKVAAKKWSDEFGLSPNWLLLEVGDMTFKEHIDSVVDNILDQCDIRQDSKRTYPLIPIEAVAGYGEDESGITYEDCEQYLVPDFEARGMEFLIRISGSSMYPKYSNGDVLACKKIRELLFFQWGKVYVIDSSQGQLVKRLYEDKNNPDNVICVSENKEKYPPFPIPKSDIRSVSLVVGVLKME